MNRLESDGFDTDVLIVGAGPAGAATALALATYGVRAHMITRYGWLSNTPRAHITNQRAMEVFRDLGVEDEVRQYGAPWEVMGDTTFATSLTGREIARIRTWGSGGARHGEYVQGSPCPLVDITQPHLEAVLLRNAAVRGATAGFNVEYLSHVQDDLGVTVRLRDRLRGGEFALRARYLVGADGARSAVLQHAGLGVVGELGRASTAYVQFRADLSSHMAHRPSILNWIVSPEAGYGEIGMGLLRAVEPWNVWIAGWGFDPAQGDPDFSEEAVRRRVRTLVGDPDLEIDIEATSVWQVNQAYAPQYSVGRVFCAGDAVHRHPPSGGLGSNTCVQDAFNLAWKLAYVLQGYAGSGLLATYSDERAPVGRQIVERATRSRVEYAPLRAALGGVSSAEELATLLDDPTEVGVDARRALTAAVAVKHYEFNAQGVELNQRYESSAVVSDVEEEVWHRDRELHLQATTRPGAKFPHAWLVDRNGLRVSTLDRVGRGRMTLVTGIAGGAWRTAVEALGEPMLDVLTIGSSDAQDLYQEWAEMRAADGLDEAGALLVRPDGYVAWRASAREADPARAGAALAAALSAVMDRKIVYPRS